MSSRVATLAAIGLVAVVVLGSPGAASAIRDPAPQSVVKREVHYRDTNGNLATTLDIPSGSVFGSSGGAGQPCTFQNDAGEAQQSFHWIFYEGLGVPIDIPSNLDNPTFKDWFVTPPTAGPLDALPDRHFTVFCEKVQTWQGLVAFINVPATDPFFDVRGQIPRLWTGLHLDKPVQVADPSITNAGGLITRHPSWFSITPDSWGTRRSTPDSYKGWLMWLGLRPVKLDFTLNTPGGTVSVPCVDTTASRVRPAVGADRFPAIRADRPVWSEPGVGGALGLGGCLWTPGVHGDVTSVATITYAVTFYVATGTGTFSEPLAPYVWSSNPVTYTVGSLSVVNVDNP